jgi:hypothetical protein
VLFIVGATMMTAMPVVHKEMHEGTGQQKKVRQNTEHVRRMLSQQEEAGNREEDAKNNPEWSAPPRAMRCRLCHS